MFCIYVHIDQRWGEGIVWWINWYDRRHVSIQYFLKNVLGNTQLLRTGCERFSLVLGLLYSHFQSEARLTAATTSGSDCRWREDAGRFMVHRAALSTLGLKVFHCFLFRKNEEASLLFTLPSVTTLRHPMQNVNVFSGVNSYRFWWYMNVDILSKKKVLRLGLMIH